ncbi:MAG: hypothetical protein LM522_01350 [Candidatus Contendobacter sp.]|nr:hypothetical protein [Candidatus Contendobacter sp.]
MPLFGERSTAANGHVSLAFPKTTPWLAFRLALTLRFKHGFRREGRRVFGFDETIVPDFVRGDIRLLAGWDNWSGVYLLADSPEADTFLNEAAERGI